MNDILKKIIMVAAMLGILLIASLFGRIGIQVISVAVVAMMIAEWIYIGIKTKFQHKVLFGASLAWLLIMLAAAYVVGGRPFIMLLLLLVIAFADMGAWYFGQKIGGAKLWPEVSPNKRWSGQIAGIICGTFAAILYGLVTTSIAGGGIHQGAFMPQLMWIGISVALLSQYGDLTASAIKRRLGIKDFSNVIPGHGGVLDRFDGWIYALPIVWLIMI
jgi:phosphatidate cytidylyltransferase